MPKTHELLRTPDWINQKYHEERMSIPEMAAEIGQTSTAIINAMKRLGIRSRTPLETRMLRGNTERKTKFPMLRNKEWLEKKYIQENLSLEEIGNEIGCTHVHVLKALQKQGISRREAGVTREGVTRSDRNDQLYDKDWLIEQYITLGRSPMDIALEVGCSDSTLSGALARYRIHRKNPRPTTNAEALIDVRRTKTSISSTGKRYVRLWMPDHPNAVTGYVLEHRLVCEKVLGRYLTRKEVVHHVNDDSEDNRPENLMVFPDNGTHVWFERHPPKWVPFCECCGHALLGKLTKRPDDVPMEWKPD